MHTFHVFFFLYISAIFNKWKVLNPIVASNSVRNSILASFRLFAYCNLHNLNHFSIFTATKVACQKCNQYTTKLSSIRQREAIKEFHFSCFQWKLSTVNAIFLQTLPTTCKTMQRRYFLQFYLFELGTCLLHGIRDDDWNQFHF